MNGMGDLLRRFNEHHFIIRIYAENIKEYHYEDIFFFKKVTLVFLYWLYFYARAILIFLNFVHHKMTWHTKVQSFCIMI